MDQVCEFDDIIGQTLREFLVALTTLENLISFQAQLCALLSALKSVR